MQYLLYKDCGVVWIGKYTLSWTTEAPLFSERYGYRKPFVRLGRLRMFFETAPVKPRSGAPSQ